MSSTTLPASPLPWFVEKTGSGWHILDANRDVVAHVPIERDARFIADGAMAFAALQQARAERDAP